MKTTPRARSAVDGTFVKLSEAKRNPRETVVERVPVRQPAPAKAPAKRG